jgi:hypothetical protein
MKYEIPHILATKGSTPFRFTSIICSHSLTFTETAAGAGDDDDFVRDIF